MPMLDVDGTDLHYEERSSGRPVLFIHGAGGSADVWGDALGLLAGRHRTIAYDRRGYSRSVHAPVRDVQRHREDARALLDALDAAPATVVGWSSGATLALDLAVHHPEVVSALVLEEPPLHRKTRPGPGMLLALIRVQILHRVRGPRVASEAFFRWAFRYTSGGTGYARIPDEIREILLSNGEPNMVEGRWATGEHLTTAELAGITCPSVVLVGEFSEPSLARGARHAAALVPRSRLVEVAGAGHALHLECPRDFVAAIDEAVT